MKIRSVRPYIQKMALTKPYTIAYNTYYDVSLVFIEIELENGITGIGSASPAEEVVGENAEQTLSNLQSTYIQNLVGRDIRHFPQILYETRSQFHNLPGTLAALDIALHDAFGKFLDISIATLYGRKTRSLPTSVTIGIMNVADTILEADNYHQLGFRIIKVKTGLNVEEDIERIQKLYEKFSDRLKIRVDANQGYTIGDLKKFISATKNIDLELIEQPLPVGQEALLLEIEDSYRSMITGDESIKDAKAALQYAAYPQPFGIYNIKLMKCGGITAARSIANIAEHAGIDVFWGCNDESIVSITAALHAAYSCPNTRYLDLDGSFDLAEDLVTGGFSLVDGYMQLNELPGLGIQKNK